MDLLQLQWFGALGWVAQSIAHCPIGFIHSGKIFGDVLLDFHDGHDARRARKKARQTRSTRKNRKRQPRPQLRPQRKRRRRMRGRKLPTKLKASKPREKQLRNERVLVMVTSEEMPREGR